MSGCPVVRLCHNKGPFLCWCSYMAISVRVIVKAECKCTVNKQCNSGFRPDIILFVMICD